MALRNCSLLFDRIKVFIRSLRLIVIGSTAGMDALSRFVMKLVVRMAAIKPETFLASIRR